MHSTIVRLIRGAALVGALLIGLIGFVAPAQADPKTPSDCPSNYAPPSATNTKLTLSPPKPDPGSTFTATATVSTGGVPVTGGNVTFSFARQSGDEVDTDSQPVVNGTATSKSFTVPTSGGKFVVTANYEGNCAEAVLGTSRSRKPIVAGVEASRGSSGRPAEVAGVSATRTPGALAATGLTDQTQLYGLLGLGMVAVGALALLVHRRQAQA